MSLREPGASATELVNTRLPVDPGAGFITPPPAAGSPPYRLGLAAVIGPERASAIARAGALRFHCVGDTGGEGDPAPQRWVAEAMAAELREPSPASFFDHLGDVVYPHGERDNYRDQFEDPYAGYDAPIFAVPGNHDAEGAEGLEPFLDRFCRADPTADRSNGRPPSRQPNVFWTLVHDWVRIIGLHSNTPEGGQIADEQREWLVGELAVTGPDTTLIVALHQPPVSVDSVHGSNLNWIDVLDECAGRAGRGPDAVFSGHAHIYQRFTRHGERETPFIVAGAGGFPLLHPVGPGVASLPATFAGLGGFTLDSYEDRAHGFLTVTVGPAGAEAIYTAVDAAGARPVDRFRIAPPSS